MKYLILIVLIFSFNLNANTNVHEQNINEKVSKLEKPLYNPFVENYILNELKQLREENRNLKVEIHSTLAKKEVDINNSVINYATSTINNMFYIIATASSILVIIGWTSIREINEKVRSKIEEKTSKTINEYELRMSAFEESLSKRASQVKQNEQDIIDMNLIHSLWLRASTEATPSGKIEIYDEILETRPNDIEAITFKADAALNLGEANWSLKLSDQALEIDSEYSEAFYQRAKAYSVLQQEEHAIQDLEKAISLNENYLLQIEDEEIFKENLDEQSIKNLLV
jgi:tetratricopeptide (TPR) repeat protein